MQRLLPAALLTIGLSFIAIASYAQDFPVRGINLIVPNPPGGMNQIHAQPLGAVIEKLYKQPAPVLNKPGATAAAGTAFVANQAPDGYNLLVTTPNLYLATEKDKLFGIQSPYTLEQIVPVALLSADPLAFCVQTENPIKSIKELVAAAKAKQGAMSFSSSGPYGITHVPAAMFMDAAGIKMRHVPTMKEAGYDVEAYLWVGLFTTHGVPEPIMTKLRDVVRKSVADPLFQDAMAKSQVVIDYRDAPDFKKFFDADYKRLAGAVKAIGRSEDTK